MGGFKLWRASLFRTELKKCLCKFLPEATADTIKPHSFRAGRTVELCRAILRGDLKLTFMGVVQMGRWKNLESIEPYIKATRRELREAARFQMEGNFSKRIWILPQVFFTKNFIFSSARIPGTIHCTAECSICVCADVLPSIVSEWQVDLSGHSAA